MIQQFLTKLNKSIVYNFLYYKHFYKFIFLHKPLCEKYKDSTIKIFGLYVCRSCLYLYFGLIISFIYAYTMIKTVQYDKFFFLGICGAALTFLVSYPPIYSKFKRITKDFIRFYDGIFLAAIFVFAFKINTYIGVLSIISFIIMRNLYNKKRSGDLVCKDCEKLVEGKTCEGYIKQKEALLRMDDEYSQIITKQMKKGKQYD